MKKSQHVPNMPNMPIRLGPTQQEFLARYMRIDLSQWRMRHGEWQYVGEEPNPPPPRDDLDADPKCRWPQMDI